MSGCRHLKLCGSLSELEHLPKGPKVVLASGPSFESGMSRQLLLQWAEDAHNAIIITQKPDVSYQEVWCLMLLCTMLHMHAKLDFAVVRGKQLLCDAVPCTWDTP